MYNIIYDTTKYFSIVPALKKYDIVQLSNFMCDLEKSWFKIHDINNFFWKINFELNQITINNDDEYVCDDIFSQLFEITTWLNAHNYMTYGDIYIIKNNFIIEHIQSKGKYLKHKIIYTDMNPKKYIDFFIGDYKKEKNPQIISYINIYLGLIFVVFFGFMMLSVIKK